MKRGIDVHMKYLYAKSYSFNTAQTLKLKKKNQNKQYFLSGLIHYPLRNYKKKTLNVFPYMTYKHI